MQVGYSWAKLVEILPIYYRDSFSYRSSLPISDSMEYSKIIINGV